MTFAQQKKKKVFYVTSLLSALKGQTQHNNVFKRHLIMIPIWGKIFYNYISTINYVIGVSGRWTL